MRYFLTSLWILSTLLGAIYGQALSTMNISLSPVGSCANKTELKIGDSCSFEMVIRVPQLNTTMMYLELFTSDNTSLVMAQLCKPTIIIGSNYNITKAPIPLLSSSLENFQFDQASIDFGIIKNSGSSSNDDDNSIKIIFNVVVIENSEPDQSPIWITAGAEYYEGNEIWIGQTSFTYKTDSTSSSTSNPSFESNTAHSQTAIGKFGFFETRLLIDNPRVINLSLSAVPANDSIQNSVILCSIHIKSAGWCFDCVDSTKAYIRSVYSKETNLVSLNLGNIVNIGTNLNNVSSSYIDFFVAYKVSDSAALNELFTIKLSANVNDKIASIYHNVQVTEAGSSTIATIPTVKILGNNNPVSIFQAFNITMIIDFPHDYDNYLEVESVAVDDALDGLPRAKVCSAVVISSGENMPCPKCMNSAKFNSFPLNSSLYSTHTGMRWSHESVSNYNLRTINDKLDVNTITISVIGQILNHPSNFEGSNISIPVGITFGNQTIWVSDNLVIVAGGANYSTLNVSLPTFSILNANGVGPNEAKVRQPQPIYFDMYTKPGSLYEPMDIEIIMPETELGSNIPAATLCTVKMHYVGIYSKCAQQMYVNDRANNQLTYLQRMIKFKNDKAILKLPALCNSAPSNLDMDPIDGLVRFLIYFQLDDDPNVPTTNHITIGTRFTSDKIFVGSIIYTKSNALPESPSSAAQIHSFAPSTNLVTSGGVFSSTNLIVKIPPNSLYGYNLDATLTSSLTSGYAALCTIRILEQGEHVPCQNPLKHSFGHSEELIKNYDFAIAGPICNINNKTTLVNNTNVWDKDSVKFQILTRPSRNATGNYSIQLELKDQFSNAILDNKTFRFNMMFVHGFQHSNTLNEWSSGKNIHEKFFDNLYRYRYKNEFSSINSSIIGVDPTDPRYVFASSNYLTFYKGQTSIIRFNLTIDESKNFDTDISISCNPADDAEIIRFYIIYLGDNFPCSSKLTKATYLNGSLYTKEIKLNLGNVAYYPIDPDNITSSTIFLEAQVRIPLSSSKQINSQIPFEIKTKLDNVEVGEISKILNAELKDPADLISNVSEKFSVNFTNQSVQSASIRQSLKINLAITIPPYSNCRAKIVFSCVHNQRQFCHFNSLKIVSFGKNVDGLKSEYEKNLMLTNFNKSVLAFYNDTAILDLGIVTNTHYSQKINNYHPDDDIIHLETDILVSDDQISDHDQEFNLEAKVYLNTDQQILDSQKGVKIQRTFDERPLVKLITNLLNSTNVVNSNSVLSVNFYIEHEENSNAEAYNVTVIFYLPTYITFLVKNNCSLELSLVESSIIFKLDRLHFGEIATCVFNIKFDELNQYSTIMNNFGHSPSVLKLPYMMIYEKFFRNGDPETKFHSNFSFIELTPPTVSITSIPNNSLKSLLADVPCRITSSVPEVSNVYNSGWKFGYRSYHWLKSLGSFVTISFVDLAKISKINFRQLPNDGTATSFTEFRIAFSEDNVTFAHLPYKKTNTILGDSFSYIFPNKFVQCRYLRIYITDVPNRSELINKKTGFVIDEIFGEFSPTSSVSCPAPQVSSYYAPRSYLYDNINQKLYVCDETADRSSSECYSSSDQSPSNWMVMSKIVSTVVFYIKDLISEQEFLYGIAKDKSGFVRSDDGGTVWKIVSPREFNEMIDNSNENQIYHTKFYQKINLNSPNSVNEGSWSFSVNGVLYGGSLRFDWFN